MEYVEPKEIVGSVVGRVIDDDYGSSKWFKLCTLDGNHRAFLYDGSILIGFNKGDLIVVDNCSFTYIPPEYEEEVLELVKSGELFRKPLEQIFHMLVEMDLRLD